MLIVKWKRLNGDATFETSRRFHVYKYGHAQALIWAGHMLGFKCILLQTWEGLLLEV